jgi:site-specific DNA recombinase
VKVATLIVKDMSRLDIEYLEVDRLTEIVFPSYDVRFIAMNDGVDSLYVYGDNEFTPFKNNVIEQTEEQDTPQAPIEVA